MRKVSVIVPCHNVACYLKKCMESLLHQSIGAENMEIILVDDASTDGGKTWDLILGYERRYPDIVMAVSLDRNLRQGGARNVGVSHASGEYLIFCDADDVLLREALEHCYDAAREHDADVVEFLFQNVTDHEAAITLEKGTDDQFIEIRTENERKEFLLNINNRLSLGSQKKFYKRSLIQKNQVTFAENLIFEEPSFVVPVRLYEKRHFFLDERIYVYYMSRGSTMRGDWEREHKWDNLKVWVSLMEDLIGRGAFQVYHEELEYLFLEWGFGLSVKMIFTKGGSLTNEEWRTLTGITLGLFPHTRENRYIREAEKSESYKVWESALLSLLGMGFTDRDPGKANQLTRMAMWAAFGGGPKK